HVDEDVLARQQRRALRRDRRALVRIFRLQRADQLLDCVIATRPGRPAQLQGFAIRDRVIVQRRAAVARAMASGSSILGRIPQSNAAGYRLCRWECCSLRGVDDK
ncbi:MAG TPA: hypothetical protein VH083_22355, partial [Myxococcales bacterium]|nr:hypothetical protein [Myxococcales bacterium]